MTRRPLWIAAGLVALIALVASVQGCGVPTDDGPRPLDPSVTLGSYEGPPIGSSPGTVVVRLYLTRGDQLVAVERRVAAAPSLDGQLRDLVAGPTAEERDRGFDSALAGTDYIAGVQLQNGIAVVGLAEENAMRNDEILAYGQIVCTLTSRADVSGVQFAHGGLIRNVPRADSSLTTSPLTAADYETLFGR